MTHLLWISLGLLLFSMHGTPPCSAANDTLTAGEELAVGDKLVSRNGRFTLGFFQPSVVSKSGNITSPNCMALAIILDSSQIREGTMATTQQPSGGG
ncbi:hypothetical protein E2562_038059 [Oryza meyeriana var. granulata]|uniref:non-specific serine/threonine protein kinase n=1 Tax=Oryza meyeriana var. granulata TaxID=110450 RepID=A0A6G1EUA4_9ORYZ|nr:hypothetical protein E2562_038059 [Oryza meyeriana var. granulata]